jgi:hypothetical protein
LLVVSSGSTLAVSKAPFSIFRVGLPFETSALSDFFLVGLSVGLSGRASPFSVCRIGLPFEPPTCVDFFPMGLLVGARGRNSSSSILRIFCVSCETIRGTKTRLARPVRMQPGRRRRGRSRAQKPAAAALATGATRAGHACRSAGLRAIGARVMANAHKISAAAGERKAHPASAELEPTSGSCLKHTPPALRSQPQKARASCMRVRLGPNPLAAFDYHPAQGRRLRGRCAPAAGRKTPSYTDSVRNTAFAAIGWRV